MSAPGNFLFDDATYNIVRWQQGGEMLDGSGTPAVGLNDSFMTDNLSITTASQDNTVLLTGAGSDWINLEWSGNTSLDPGSGMNFIIGSSNTLNLYDESSAAPVTNTIQDFHPNDTLTLNGNFIALNWQIASNGDAQVTALSQNAAPVVNDFQGLAPGQFQTVSNGHGYSIWMPSFH